jgi:hypothetical protein
MSVAFTNKGDWVYINSQVVSESWSAFQEE